MQFNNAVEFAAYERTINFCKKYYIQCEIVRECSIYLKCINIEIRIVKAKCSLAVQFLRKLFYYIIFTLFFVGSFFRKI